MHAAPPAAIARACFPSAFGIGIPSKLHNNLFDKFNPTRRAGLQGEITTGLGLFIAKQIVELHGGAIWLESREKEGTTFFIELA